jgi:hypothetical protein
VKAICMLAGIVLTSSAATSADLGAADLPRVHAEYKANQARWAREFLDKTFAATMPIGGISNVFGNDSFMVTFMENSSDWMPGVACHDAPTSDFPISKNKGDSIFFRGVVKDHSVGSLDLRDCEFFDSEKAASDADAKRLADDAAARDQEARQAAADEAKQIAMQTAALDESARAAASASVPQPSASDFAIAGNSQRYVPWHDSEDRQALQRDNRPRLGHHGTHQRYVRQAHACGLHP